MLPTGSNGFVENWLRGKVTDLPTEIGYQQQKKVHLQLLGSFGTDGTTLQHFVSYVVFFSV